MSANNAYREQDIIIDFIYTILPFSLMKKTGLGNRTSNKDNDNLVYRNV